MSVAPLSPEELDELEALVVRELRNWTTSHDVTTRVCGTIAAYAVRNGPPPNIDIYLGREPEGR